MAANLDQLRESLASCDPNKENISFSRDGESKVFFNQSQSIDQDQETRSETQSPRRMKDIHLDGNVDDMRNVNPYLLDDRDLDVRSDVGGVVGSMSSLVSGRSSTVRSAGSSRRPKIKSAGTPGLRSNAGSRARQLKDHEGSPFLSIGTPLERNAFSPEIIKGKLSRSHKGSRHSSLLSVSTTGLTSTSAKSSVEMTSSARNHRTKLFSSGSLVPPSKRTPEPNHNVKMPFKHSVKKPDLTVTSSNPSVAAMKDRTAIATHTLNKLLHAQKPTHTAYVQGRLLKARLKPLEPVKVTTPTIQQCRGIIAETRQYGQCESRTFQRWKAIMAGNHKLPAAAASSRSMDLIRDGASTSESVHLTSQASTPEPPPGMDSPTTFVAIDNEEGDDDADWADELGGGPINDSGIPQTTEVPPPFSLPNSRCAPAHCDEALSHLGGPAMTPVPMTHKGQGQGRDATPAMLMMMSSSSYNPASLPRGGGGAFTLQQQQQSSQQLTATGNDGVVLHQTTTARPTTTTEEEVEIISNGIMGTTATTTTTSDIVGDATTVTSGGSVVSDVGHSNNNDAASGVASLTVAVPKRPHSAVYPRQVTNDATSAAAASKDSRLAGRPRTAAVDGARKAVRFADDENNNNNAGSNGSAIGRKGSGYVNADFFGGGEEGGVNKQQGGGGGGKRSGKGTNNGKSSCRPRSLDSGFDDRDGKDDDDDGGGVNGGGGGGGGRGRTFLTQGFGGTGSQTNSNQQQQQKGGRSSSSQGNNGKQNTLESFAKSKSSAGPDLSDNIPISTSSGEKNVINSNRPISSSCLSASVCYNDSPDEKLTNLKSKNNNSNPKAGFITPKKMNDKRSKTPRDCKKSNSISSASSKPSNAAVSLSSNKSANGCVVSGFDDADAGDGGDAKASDKKTFNIKHKSSLCKQESRDSGIDSGSGDGVVRDKNDDEHSGSVTSHQSEAETNCIAEKSHCLEGTATTSTIVASATTSTTTAAPQPPPTRMIRPSSSSVKRMKAYKTLAAKSKRGNVRPYSSSVYSDVEIQDRKTTNKQRKDANLRPASAVSNSSYSSCSDILQIQGKYGLYAGAKTKIAKNYNSAPTPATTTPKSRISSASLSNSSNLDNEGENNKSRNYSKPSSSLPSPSKSSITTDAEEAQEESELLKYYHSLQVENNNDNVFGEKNSSSLRLRSASKVTFADEDEYEDDRWSRKSNGTTSAKSGSRRSSILRGSAGTATGYTHTKGGNNRFGDGNQTAGDDIDYDQMWAELPDDNSDAEKSLDGDYDAVDNYANDDDESVDDDNFMSKFDRLQNQFDAVAAEFEVERCKLSREVKDNNLIPSSSSNNLNLNNSESSELLGSVLVSEEEMAMIRKSGYRLESDNTTVFVTDNSAFDFDDDHDDDNSGGHIIDAGNSCNNENNNNNNNMQRTAKTNKLDHNQHLSHSSIRQQKSERDSTITAAPTPCPEFLHYQEPEWKDNGWVSARISQNLYKSTNRYVEVKPKEKDNVLPRGEKEDGRKSSSSSIVTSRVDHGQKKNLNSKGGNNNYQGRKGSKGDNHNDDDPNLNSGYRKPVYKMGNDGEDAEASNFVHIIIPSIDDFGFGFSCEGTAKAKSHRALPSSRPTTPAAARKLARRSKNGNDNDSDADAAMRSKNSNKGKKTNKDGSGGSDDLCIEANSCNIVDDKNRAATTTPTPIPVSKELMKSSRPSSSGNNNASAQNKDGGDIDDKNSKRKSSSTNHVMLSAASTTTSKKETEEGAMVAKSELERRSDNSNNNDNYYDLLLAYRSHCMEDSDDDDDDDDDNQNVDDIKEIINDSTLTSAQVDDNNFIHIIEKEEKDKVFEAKDKSRSLVISTSENDTGNDEGGNKENTDGDDGEKFDDDGDNDRSTQIGGKSTGEEVDGDGSCHSNRIRSRPISAVTTDSGLDSDSSPADEDRSRSRNDQSQARSRRSSNFGALSGGSQSPPSRPDSGVLSDLGAESGALEIVASSKNLIKQRPSSAASTTMSASHPNEDVMEKLCALPPLCFRLNARPPTGFLYYFAYGPNMNSDRISCYLGCEKSPPRFWGLLFGFGLVFNMKGTASNSEQVGGLPNLEWNPGMSVEGCVYQITPPQLERLDKFVGYPKTVEHVVLPVWMSNSLDSDSLGVAQYCVPALTFIARDEFTWKEPIAPSDYSVSQCLKSADLVTPEFKGHLASFSSNNQRALVVAS